MNHSKIYTTCESQIKLNAAFYNAASLLKTVTGKVSLTKLKKNAAEDVALIKKMGGSEEQVQRALFIVCNQFNITVD